MLHVHERASEHVCLNVLPLLFVVALTLGLSPFSLVICACAGAAAKVLTPSASPRKPELSSEGQTTHHVNATTEAPNTGSLETCGNEDCGALMASKDAHIKELQAHVEIVDDQLAGLLDRFQALSQQLQSGRAKEHSGGTALPQEGLLLDKRVQDADKFNMAAENFELVCASDWQIAAQHQDSDYIRRRQQQSAQRIVSDPVPRRHPAPAATSAEMPGGEVIPQGQDENAAQTDDDSPAEADENTLAKSKDEALVSQLKTLQQSLDKLKNDLASTQAELLECKAEHECTMREMRQHLEDAKQNVAGAKEENSKMQQHLQAKTEEIHRLSEQADAARISAKNAEPPHSSAQMEMSGGRGHRMKLGANAPLPTQQVDALPLPGMSGENTVPISEREMDATELELRNQSTLVDLKKAGENLAQLAAVVASKDAEIASLAAQSDALRAQIQLLDPARVEGGADALNVSTSAEVMCASKGAASTSHPVNSCLVQVKMVIPPSRCSPQTA